MLDASDFKSIWEIGYRWEDQEPPSNETGDIPSGVVEKFDKLIWAFRRDRFGLRYASGDRVLKDDLFDIFILDRTLIRLIRCLKTKKYPYSLLAQRFVYRADLLKWCEDEYIEPPEFWLNPQRRLSDELEVNAGGTQESSDSSPERKAFLDSLVSSACRHRNSKIDSMICQAVARTLWDEHPDMTIEDMKKHRAIQVYGNGRAYPGKNTLRDWLSAVDPRAPETKSGRRKGK